MQLDQLRDYVVARGWTAIEFVDEGVSGTKVSRPALDKMMALCRKRKIDAVLVYKFDRFARSLRQLVNGLDEFSALGIDFISITEAVDTTTPAGRLIFGIFSSIAEFEKELIRERVKSGMAAAARRGIRPGPPALLKARADEVLDMRRRGVSVRLIAKELKMGVGSVMRLSKGGQK